MELKKLRQEIDKTDEKLLRVLGERFALTEKVGEYKKKHQLEAQDKEREEQVFIQREKWAEEFGVGHSLVKELFELIIKRVCQEHKNKWKRR
ncbi:chorismate mutase [Candidatus Parcubacteria bacterium]|nr:chorismate mutase [Candidatus Parcubacteria bacterium]